MPRKLRSANNLNPYPMLRLLVLFFSVGINLLTIAQDSTRFSRVVLKMSPQHLTLNMLKTGVEIFNKKRDYSLIILVGGVANNDTPDEFDIFNHNFPYTGGGAEFHFRKYRSIPFRKQNRLGQAYDQGIYWSTFLQGNAYDGGDSGYFYVINPTTGTNDRMHYSFHQSIKNAAVGFTVGLQRTLWKILTADVYVGAGYQQSWITNSSPPPIRYTQHSGELRPGHQGILPKAGFMIGAML
jgi:hypothetical protein